MIMKMNFKTTLILLLLTASLTSCNNEELFVEPVMEEVLEKENDEKEDESLEEDIEIDPTIPCDFNLNSVEPNSTVIINCVLDLSGQTINLPDNVNIEAEGGDIINGTINFGNNNTLGGELLNSSLTISGSVPQLKDTSFVFEPTRWGIVEGVVTDEIAIRNKEIIQNTIDLAKSFGIKTFSIGKMDCYIGVGGIYSLGTDVLKNGIQLPSNFSLLMDSETFLRVQPNKWPRSSLLNAYISENVTVKGGNLIGDRYSHDYSPINDEFGISRNSHEWPTLLSIAGCRNVLIEDVYMTDSTGDAFVFASGTNRLYNPAIYCENVTVRNCTMNASRRNNITFGDGEYLTVENCLITNAGGGENILDANGKIKTYTSAGVAPQFGIDLEAHRELDSSGKYVDFQKIEHVTIKGNTFKGNSAGDIVLFTANDVLIEDNDCDNTIGGLLFYNCVIKNNRLTQNQNGVKTSVGIGFNAIIRDGKHQVRDNKIIGNTIIGFDTALSPGGQNIEVSNNTLRDFSQGMYIRNIVDSDISYNDYKTDRKISYCYQSFGGEANNVKIHNENINVKHRPINFFNFNKNGLGNITFEECKIDSPKEIYLNQSKNITIKNNLIKFNRITEVDCENIITENNLDLN